jgi:hypothetical protein
VQLALAVHVAEIAPPRPLRQQISPPWQFAVPRQSTGVPVQPLVAVHEGIAAPPP